MNSLTPLDQQELTQPTLLSPYHPSVLVKISRALQTAQFRTGMLPNRPGVEVYLLGSVCSRKITSSTKNIIYAKKKGPGNPNSSNGSLHDMFKTKLFSWLLKEQQLWFNLEIGIKKLSLIVNFYLMSYGNNQKIPKLFLWMPYIFSLYIKMWHIEILWQLIIEQCVQWFDALNVQRKYIFLKICL